MENDIRNIMDGARDDRTRAGRYPDAPDPGTRGLVAVTTTITTYPTVAQAFYGLRWAEVSGTEREGQTATITPVGGTFAGLNLGNTIPPPGTAVLVFQSSQFFEFEY